jgi:16S rRNA C967 or C1407 C5-methylase (RsmB/RsmF family)
MTAGSLGDLLAPAELADFYAALQSHPPRCIRLRPGVSAAQLPMATRAVPWHPWGRLIEEPQRRPSTFLAYAAGDYYIQDAGSLLALALLQPQPAETICDLCAAPGGKASAILEAIDARGFLIANEPIQSRVEILRHLLARTGSLSYAVLPHDPAVLAARFPGCFDAVLVDAPCSGQTLLAHGKRGENAFDPKQIEHAAARQQRILRQAIGLLKPGGRLVYATCTFAYEENEAQIEGLLRDYPNAWEALSPAELAPWASPWGAGCYRLWPHRHPTAGAFAAGLRLVDELPGPLPAPSSSPPQRRRGGRSQAGWALAPASNPLQELGDWQVGLFACDRSDPRNIPCHGVSASLPAVFLSQLSPAEWPCLGVAKRGYVRPEHALALLKPSLFTPRVNLQLDDEQARHYLRGEPLLRPYPTDDAGSGWTVLSWQNRPLGWGKCAQNRINNHLPRLAFLDLHPADREDPDGLNFSQ